MTREEAIVRIENLADSVRNPKDQMALMMAFDDIREQEEREKENNSELMRKLDVNNLFRNIDDVISNSRSKIVRENGFGIAIGLDLLSKYLMEIGKLAIKQDNQELIDILIDLHVLIREEGD